MSLAAVVSVGNLLLRGAELGFRVYKGTHKSFEEELEKASGEKKKREAERLRVEGYCRKRESCR
jgi:hypothetical protein